MGGDVLLRYQRELLEATSQHHVVVCEKSRRIGATWAIAADAVLAASLTRAAGGQDVFYIGYNLDMTREFVDTCAMWARSFQLAANEVQEFIFTETDERGADRAIQAFRIRFASGFELVALCSRPRALRGRQGYVIIDEAAFHDQLEELLKAALALLIWGGRVLVISTHDGVDNPFALLVDDCRAGRRPFKVVRTTFAEALADGLYRRVCLVRGMEWTEHGERQWTEEIRSVYGDAATEELDCIPRASGGRYLTRALLEARATADIPVIRWQLADTFVDLPEFERTKLIGDRLREEIAPLLALVDEQARTALGQDFGRSGDLSVIWPLVERPGLQRHTPFVLELRNVPFSTQRQILWWICDRLRIRGAALDARGNGQQLAEETRQRYGAGTIAEVMLSEPWYREHMPRMKAALEDSAVDLPRDASIIDDLRGLEVVRGVARVPDKHTGSRGAQRHGDAAITLVLALFAAATLDGGPVEYSTAGGLVSLEGYAGDLSQRSNLTGWI